MNTDKIRLKTTHIDRNTAVLSHEVEKVSDLPEWAENETYIFVNEKKWLYVFRNGQWIEFVPENSNSAGYDLYQQRMLKSAKTRRIPKEEEAVLESMMIAKFSPTYGKKKEPEIIGDRVYTDPYWRDIPVIFGIFGVEMVIGTGDVDKKKNPEPKIMARDYETDEDRIKVNISNFILFLVEKYTRAIEYEEIEIIAYNDDLYRVFLKDNKLLIKKRKRLFWKPILAATWSRHNVDGFASPMCVLQYEMKDTNIPSMADLVTKMVSNMENVLNKRAEAKKKAEDQVIQDKEAKKIYYDMLGI